MKRAFLDTPFGQIHYRIDGSGEPAIILIHGTPQSSYEYHEMIPLLSPRFKTIAMDTIGYGDSDKPAENKWFTIEDFANTVVQLQDALQIKKAVIVGHHTGSKTAIEVAAAHPERVDKLVLIGPYFWEEIEKQRGLSQAGMWSEPEPKIDGSHLTDLWQQKAVGMQIEDLQLKQRLFIDILKAGEMSHRGHYASASYRQEQRLPLIKCPTLAIWGTKDIKLHDQIGFHRRGLAEAIPNCKVVEIQGGASAITHQIPDELAQLITKFIEEVNP